MYRIGICDDNTVVVVGIEKYLLECVSTGNFEDMEIDCYQILRLQFMKRERENK